MTHKEQQRMQKQSHSEKVTGVAQDASPSAFEELDEEIACQITGGATGRQNRRAIDAHNSNLNRQPLPTSTKGRSSRPPRAIGGETKRSPDGNGKSYTLNGQVFPVRVLRII
jgi:hypothetical protein